MIDWDNPTEEQKDKLVELFTDWAIEEHIKKVKLIKSIRWLREQTEQLIDDIRKFKHEQE